MQRLFLLLVVSLPSAFVVATAAAATIATETTTAAAIAAGRPVFFRTGFHYFDVAAVYRCIIQFFNGFVGCSGVAHFHKTKAAALTGELVVDYFGRGHFPIRSKKFS